MKIIQQIESLTFMGYFLFLVGTNLIAGIAFDLIHKQQVQIISSLLSSLLVGIIITMIVFALK